MRKFIPGWIVVMAATALLVATGFVLIPTARAESAASRASALELFLDVYSMTRATYVDSLDSQELIDSALQGMLQSLDPNSMLLTPREYENLRIQLEGSFEGVGITLGQRDGWLTVVSPIEGTPAYRAGMKAGDRIVEINAETTEGMSTDEAVSRIRGPGGTVVDLTIQRPGMADSIVFNIERAVIDFPSVSTGFMLNENTGYVRMSRFSEESARDLLDMIRDLEDEGADNLIFDLRGNSGGLFNPSIDVSDIFLPAATEVVSTRGQAVGERTYYTSRGVLFRGNTVVLIDGGSASSSEIVAGALQDHEAAVIIGSRSFGKGSVQSLSDLGEYPGLGHYGVKLTTARYYTPSGRSIDRTLRDDFYEMDAFADWGIEPDISVEPHQFDGQLMANLENGSWFFKFAVDYTLEYDVSDDFWPDEEVIALYRTYLDESGFEWTETEFEQSLDYIERALLREIALREWDIDSYYRVLAPHDPYVQTALQYFADMDLTR